MKLHHLQNRKKTGYTTWGCTWKKGECPADADYICMNGDGLRVPVQSRITAYWPDGSVKWSAHTADSDLLGDEMEVTPVPRGRGQAGPAQESAGGAEVSAGEVCADESADKETGVRGIEIEEREDGFVLHAGKLVMTILPGSEELFESVSWEGKPFLRHAKPVLILEEPSASGDCLVKTSRPYRALLQEVEFEEEGPLQATVRFSGCHKDSRGEQRIPFIIRMKVGFDSKRIGFVHTFLYDGDEDRDFLKGLGLSVEMPLQGALYNRHVKFLGDSGALHESVAQMISWRPNLPRKYSEQQNRGERLEFTGQDEQAVELMLGQMPFWSDYELCQDSMNHFCIRKKIRDENCCYIDCLHGNRSPGGAAVGSEAGSVLFALRDFWETYPSGFSVKGLDGDTAQATIWLWSPGAEAMDFRHYANRGYNQVCYEGYDYKGASPYGIASTSEYSLAFCEDLIPSDEFLGDFTESVRKPAQYVGTPEYYHQCRAFGYWALPDTDSQLGSWIEEQLEKAFAFYSREAEQRNWYGLFNYGDFMHTYESSRHQWRYDVGGFAWDNTELVPTLWLWYYFLRTGREEVFTLAEKLSRHTSEVDVYHMGKYKGLGSRHNVRHWGCPCKEARIAMASHHRFYYYLTGDYRMEDIFEELKDNEWTFLNKDPLGDFYQKEEMVYPSHARSGPDWSSLCSNWMTQWERSQDTRYRDKILTGIEDIKKTPLKLISGPDFEFDPATVHLRYIGEKVKGGVHLQICMGAPQIWMEMADLLEDEEWKDMLADYGRFYFLSPEEQRKESGGLIGRRTFSYPMFATSIGAYGAARHESAQEASRVIKELLGSLLREGETEGFGTVTVANAGNREELVEIPWISTNFTAQWCLNAIVATDFIGKWMPRTMQEALELVGANNTDSFRKG